MVKLAVPGLCGFPVSFFVNINRNSLLITSPATYTCRKEVPPRSAGSSCIGALASSFAGLVF